MASVVIPPWISTTPSDFAQAAEAGQRLGLERRGQDISQQEEQQKLGMSQAEMANNAALEQQKMQMQAAESAQQQAVERQRIQATQEIAANRLRLSTDAAARKFQQQQAYQQAIQSGMDPIKAMMQFGPTMGQSMSGVGQLGLTQARERMASLPPQFVADPNNPDRTLGVTYGGQFHPAAAPRAATKGASLGGKARLAAAVKAVETARLPEDVKAAQDRLDKIAEEVDNPPSEDETGDESGGASPTQDEKDPLGLFNQSQ